MKAFLYEVAEDIIDRYPNDFERLAFIFPNKRASLFFRKYLGQLLGRTVWSPSFFTISQVIERYTQVHVPNQLSLLFMLYESYRGIKSNWSEDYSFDKFSNLGEMMLKDFNDVDNYLIDPKDIFSNIKDLAEIDSRFFYLSDEDREIIRRYWRNFTIEKLSEEKKRFLELWEDMPAIYTDFRRRLREKKSAYSGMMYRQLAEQIDEKGLQLTKYKRFIFVGFSAMNAVERKLFGHLNKTGQADFYWDTDAFYIDQPHQEAGLFLRYNLKAYQQNTHGKTPQYFKQKKQVRTVGVPLFSGQAKLLPKLIEIAGIQPHELDERTAIVLANEGMLFQVLQSLPQEADTLNITMGYPLKATNLYALLDKIIELHSRSFGKSKSFYHKSVLSILHHPMVTELENDRCSESIHEIVSQNWSYIPTDYLLTGDHPLLKLIFEPIDIPANFVLRLLDILFLLFTGGKKREEVDNEKLENEYIYHAYISLKQINDALQNHAGIYSFGFLVNILRKTLNEVSIPFTGEPLNGLQIMGVLETRNIDFENVIILGMNEGTWPKQGRSPSFISESLRQAFQLPVARQQDSIYAYLFYRLIQRANNITFVYNNLTEGQHNGEMSRLVLQLMHETSHRVEQLQLSQELIPSTPRSIEIDKSPDVMQRLTQYTAQAAGQPSGLTASAINTFIDCGLKFYFKYVVGINEQDDVQEKVDAAILGTILHGTLEIMHTQEVLDKGRQKIQKEDYRTFRKNLDQYIELAFIDTFNAPADRPFEYRNEQLVMKDVVKSLAELVLHYDEKQGEIEIVALEQKDAYVSELNIYANNTDYTVRLKGIIDRVDKLNGVVRVLDYKTGKADRQFKDWQVVFSPEVESRKKAILQTFLYGMLYYDNKPEALFPGVYDVRSMSSPDFSPYLFIGERNGKTRIDEGNFLQFLDEFKEQLNEVLSNLFNSDLPFLQTEHISHCTICPYNTICARGNEKNDNINS